LCVEESKFQTENDPSDRSDHLSSFLLLASLILWGKSLNRNYAVDE
jgi:hypothetical protein